MRRFAPWTAGIALILVTAFAPPASRAAVPADSGNVELFLGWYVPDEDVPDASLDDLTYGVRGGYAFTNHFMLQFGAQGFSTDYDTIVGRVDIDEWMFDVSMGWMANPEDKAVFVVYGGPGYVSTSFDYPTIKDVDDSSLSAHVGVGGIIQIGDRFYLRPDARYRWIDGDHDADERGDWEITLGFGWRIGGE